MDRLVRHMQLSRLQELLLRSKTLLPAGNTLAAFGELRPGVLLPIRPNCAVLEPTDDSWAATLAECVQLWTVGTGIGFNLSATANPVARLRELNDLCLDTQPIYQRPLRGNMAVLDHKHAHALDFVLAKSTPERAARLTLFNISVSLPTDSRLDVAPAAHATGCPGVIFADHLQRTPGPHSYKTLVPCGEQAMYNGETCTLASVNLNSPLFASGLTLAHAAEEGVEFLERALQLTEYTTEFTKARSLHFRRIGLGVTGFADVLHARGIAYGSDACLQLAEATAHEFATAARAASRRYGHTTSTCLPPTGGITLLTANRGFSIEPFFEQAVKIAPDRQIAVVAAFQRHICNSISKTVNLPAAASIQDVRDIFQLAREAGLRSVTVYRDTSRNAQPISLKASSS